MMPEQIINFAALKQTPVHTQPFPYLLLPDFLQNNILADMVTAFPKIKHRGSVPASAAKIAPSFQKLILALESEALRTIIADKFEMDLSHRPTMLTLRGYTTKRDGYIHTDSTSKLITLLLYMNPTWDMPDGRLRLLNSEASLEDYAVEVSPTAGTCLIFKVTPNCWHGHYPFIGKRLSIQFNYLTHEAALTKHLNHHRLSAWLKRFWPKTTSY